MSDVWAACSERVTPVTLRGTVLRLVESQEQVATHSLVRTLAEQALLEDLIEASKPQRPGPAIRLHYLLATPFRYPPLPWGSRFGRCFEPSLFYAARTADTVLAESAYYRFVFWSGMAVPPSAPLDTRHTLFSVAVGTRRGLQLQQAPFEAHSATDCAIGVSTAQRRRWARPCVTQGSKPSSTVRRVIRSRDSTSPCSRPLQSVHPGPIFSMNGCARPAPIT